MAVEIDRRRMLIRIGAAMVFSVGGPALFAKQWGVEGVVHYILILAVARFLVAEITTRMVAHSPSSGILAYQYSPSLITIGGCLPILAPESEFALRLLPVMLGSYIATFWTLHHDISETKGLGTAEFQKTEVISSVVGTVLLIVASFLYSVEIAVAMGGIIAFAGSMIRTGVLPEDMRSNLALWNLQARSRNTSEIRNGTLIARSVAAIGFCALSSLRIHVFTDPVSILGGIVSLAAILVGAELVVWCFTNKVPYDSPYLKIGGFVMTFLGFALMTVEGWGFFGLGYFLVALVSRSVNRTADREFARAALRGVGLRPGLREVTKFRMYLILTPLLWMPNILPICGMIAGVILLRCDFTHPGSSDLKKKKTEVRLSAV